MPGDVEDADKLSKIISQLQAALGKHFEIQSEKNDQQHHIYRNVLRPGQYLGDSVQNILDILH